MKNIYLTIFLIIILCGKSFAADSQKDKARPTTVNLSATSGEGGYGALNLSGGYGIDKIWRLMGSASTNKSEDGASSVEGRLGADAKFNPSVLAKLSAFSRAESVGIRSVGATPGADWTISSLWSGNLATVVFLELEFTRYSILSQSRNRRIQASDDLRQRSTTLGVTQELSDQWSVTASVTGYDYDGKDPDGWADELAYYRQVTTGVESTAKGFLRSSGTLSVTWDTLGSFIFNLALNSSKSTLGTSTRGVTLTTTYLFEDHWSADLTLGGSNTEGTNTNSGTLGVGAGYTF